jgi:hypothetical protein
VKSVAWNASRTSELDFPANGDTASGAQRDAYVPVNPGIKMFKRKTSVAAVFCLGVAALDPAGWAVSGAQSGPSADVTAGSRFVVRADPRVVRSYVRPQLQSRLRAQANLVTINVNYMGFTPQAQAAFQHAVNIWASQLTSPVTIQVDAEFAPLAPGVLGSAGPWLVRNRSGLQSNTWYPVAIANKITGVDQLPGTSDIDASFSSSFSWYYGTDGNGPSGTYDFVSVVLHELGHGLGFVGSANVTGGSGTWGSNGSPYIYDRFVENGGSQAIISFTSPSAALASQLTSNNLYFDGPATRLGNGGNPARIYAPASWQGGSSYSHLDEATYPAGNPNSLCTPQLASREAIHDPGPITWGMFEDIGWTVGTVPSPTAPTNLRVVP